MNVRLDEWHVYRGYVGGLETLYRGDNMKDAFDAYRKAKDENPNDWLVIDRRLLIV